MVLERKDVFEIGVSGTILPGTKDKRLQADVPKTGNDDGGSGSGSFCHICVIVRDTVEERLGETL